MAMLAYDLMNLFRQAVMKSGINHTLVKVSFGRSYPP